MMMESICDPREMRRIITEMRYTGASPFVKGSEISTSAILARRCLDAAQHQGFSGEDAMTLLAYHALLQLDEARSLLLKHAMNSTIPPFIGMPDAAHD